MCIHKDIVGLYVLVKKPDGMEISDGVGNLKDKGFEDIIRYFFLVLNFLLEISSLYVFHYVVGLLPAYLVGEELDDVRMIASHYGLGFPVELISVLSSAGGPAYEGFYSDVAAAVFVGTPIDI